jgi:leader peptidase (prepilin peptidase)/N-methyltransferase
MSAIELCKHSAVALFLQSVMIIDWKTHLIPNRLVLALVGIGTLLIAIEMILYRTEVLRPLLMSVAGLLCCLVLFYILSRLTKDGISMGDVKLIAAMGWVLGVSTTLFAVFFAMLLCTIAAIFLLLSKKKNKSDRIAFGPFLFFGYIVFLMLISL